MNNNNNNHIDAFGKKRNLSLRGFRGLAFTCLLMAISSLHSQTLGDYLASVEQNNTTLKALREQTKAEKLGNKTRLTPSNPEVGFGYLWGSPSGTTDNELSYSITQAFDFPTAYAHRSQLANAKNGQVDLAYEQARREIHYEARNTYITWVYYKKREAQLSERLQRADALFQAYEKMLNAGETTRIEYNKTLFNQLALRKEAEFNSVEIITFEDELRRLNGNAEPPQLTADYPIYSQLLDFETWFSAVKTKNPELLFATKEIEISRQEEKLRIAENLPKFSAGYYSEQVPGSRLQGLQAGISIPLWEGKNTLKQQKAKTFALQTEQEDKELQFRNRMKNSYEKVAKSSELLKEYHKLLDVSESLALLDKALQLGQLTLIAYVQELTDYYETIDYVLEKDWEYNLSVAELMKWEAP